MPAKANVEKKLDYWVNESIKDKKFEDAYENEGEIAKYFDWLFFIFVDWKFLLLFCRGPFAQIVKCKPNGRKISLAAKIIPKNVNKIYY